jgi:transposase-like protein
MEAAASRDHVLRAVLTSLAISWFSEEGEETREMGKRGHSEEEILRVLREAEAGETVVEVCRKHGISQQSFYLWKKKYAELLFEMLSQRYERGSTMVTSNLPFQEWTEVLGSERLTGALLDRLTHHVHILEMNGDSYRLKQSRRKRTPSSER